MKLCSPPGVSVKDVNKGGMAKGCLTEWNPPELMAKRTSSVLVSATAIFRA